MIYKIKPCCLLCEHAAIRDDGVRCEHPNTSFVIFRVAEHEYTDVCGGFELRDFGYPVESEEI